MTSVSISEARATLPHLLDRIEAGEEVVITRHGRAVAVVLRPDALRVRRADRALADAEHLHGLLGQARDVALADAPALSAERAEELVADLAAQRAAR